MAMRSICGLCKAFVVCSLASSANQRWLQVISAFDVPKMLYEPVRKCFYQAATPPKLLAGAEVWCLADGSWRVQGLRVMRNDCIVSSGT
jgi:hypothetical protein